ncbi:uncharacterized protein [Channa argus]|uniref:uncharacterized protein n=1 Tax=Channa argus TaxID=215402 RepID=UPI003521E185
MKIPGRGMNCCVALFLALTSVSAIKRLNSITDLKKVKFGQSVPEQSLVLLHWFANTVEIDSNNVIWLTFDPNNRDYGSHQYYNFEKIFDELPRGHLYYTVGNLNKESSVELPFYVVNHQMEDTGRNRARILIRVREHSMGRQRIDQVYITQHYETRHRGYDPQHTYHVTPNLLRQIQRFSVETQRDSLSELMDCFGGNADDSDLRYIRNTWGDQACLGLLLFIVMQERYSKHKYRQNRLQHSARRNTKPDFAVHIPEDRQNHQDADTSDTCMRVCLIILIIFLVIFFFLSHLRR